MAHPNESIFRATLRTFCKSFAAICGILIGCAVLIFLFMLLSPPSLVPEKTEVTIAADAQGRRELLPHSVPAFLRINIHGVIGEPDLNAGTMENILLDSREGILQGNRVKGVLLHINTPGGTVVDADSMYQALKEYKSKYNVPIYAFVDGLCASGGMYIASVADKIYASPTSVIGSIGVIMGPAFNFTGTMEKIGMQALTLTKGKDKDALNPFRPWKSDEDKSLQDVLAGMYDQFVGVVTAARPQLNREKLINDYGAQVFIASTAKNYGYIDEVDADYSKVLTDLAHAAKLKEKEKYQVFELQPKINFLSELSLSKFSLLSGRITHTFQIGHMNSDLSGKFLYLYHPE